MVNSHAQLPSPVFKTPAILIFGLIATQLLILLASIEFPMEVFIVLIGLVGFYYLLKNTFAGLCAFILLHFLVIRSTEGINPGEILFGVYFFAFLAVWFFRKIFIARERILLDAIDYALAGFLLMCVFSIVPALAMRSDPFKWLRELLPFLSLLFIFPMREQFNTQKRVKIVMLCFLLLGAIVAINNLLLYREALSAITYFWEVASSRKHANEPLLMAIVIIAASFLISGRSFRGRIIALSLLLIFTGALAVTFSRGYWAAAFLGLVFLLFRSPAKTKLRLFAYFSIFILIAFFIAFQFFGDFTALVLESLGSRVASFGHAATDLSFANRLREWSAVLAQIKANPIMGYGLGMMYKYDPIIPLDMPTWYVHNTLLFVWYKIGLVGLIFLLVFGVGMLARALKDAIAVNGNFQKTLLRGLSSCMVAMFAVSFSSPQLIEKDSALLAALICGLLQSISLPKRQQKVQNAG